MHNGYVQIDNEKMSKSLNNFFTIREVLAQYDAEVVRFFIARAHYRSPLNYSDVHIDDARNALARLYTALKDVTPDDAELDWNEAHAQRFQAAMNDDFNTPVAVSVLFELATEVNRTRDPALARQLRALGAVIGLLGREPRAYPAAGRGRRSARRARARRDRSEDRRARGRQAGEGLCGSRPDPGRIARGRRCT